MSSLYRRTYSGLISLDRDLLDTEIRESPVAGLVSKYLYLIFEADSVVAYCSLDLTGAEEDELDSIVAAHTGVAPTEAESIQFDGTVSGLSADSIKDAIDELSLDKQSISDKGQPLGYASLDAGGKIPSSQLPSVFAFKGSWNASTNSPNLNSIPKTSGDVYIVNVAGSTDLDGVTDWNVKDWAIYTGSVWEKVDNTDSVSSVFGRTGAVSALSGDYTATQILYSNSTSGIPSATVQGSIDNLDSRIDSLEAAPAPLNDRVRTSATDTTAGFLLTKLLAGSNISLTQNNPGSDETLTISSTSSAPTFPFANIFNDDDLVFDDGPVTLVLDEAEPALDSNYYTLSNNELTVVQSGLYAIYYGVTLVADGSNGDTAYYVWLEKQNTLIDGSVRMVHIPRNGCGNSCSDFTIQSITAGQKLRIRSEQESGNRDAEQQPNTTRLLVVRLGD